MHRLTAVILACALPLLVRGETSPASGPPAHSWVERSNQYTNTLLEVHSPSRDSTAAKGGFDYALVGDAADTVRSSAEKIRSTVQKTIEDIILVG